jgi:hypothetical protein
MQRFKKRRKVVVIGRPVIERQIPLRTGAAARRDDDPHGAF